MSARDSLAEAVQAGLLRDSVDAVAPELDEAVGPDDGGIVAGDGSAEAGPDMAGASGEIEARPPQMMAWTDDAGEDAASPKTRGNDGAAGSEASRGQTGRAAGRWTGRSTGL